MQSVSLDNIGGGALRELFGEELDRVLANIADPNTDATQRRSITITVSLKPKADRELADVDISCSSKTAGIKSVSTQFFMGRKDGRYVAVENDPRQSNLFDAPRPQATGTVASFPTKAGE